MISNEEKINIIINKLNNIERLILSFIENAEVCKNKYILDDELLICYNKKEALLETLKNLGGTWKSPYNSWVCLV